MAVAEMVKAVKQSCGTEFCVSVKIRIHKDLRYASDLRMKSYTIKAITD